MWTARAESYRKTQGFNAFPSIAVVVQQMVESEVSGVMFTGNPINTATDAERLFGDSGIDGVGLRAISRAAGHKNTNAV